MSGGSFDYLYCRPLDEAIKCDAFDRMADAIAEYPDGQRAALELRSIRSAFDALADRWAALERVMRAVEWDHSGDSGPEDVAIELAKYNATAATPSDPDRDAAYSRAVKAMERLTAELNALAPKEAPMKLDEQEKKRLNDTNSVLDALRAGRERVIRGWTRGCLARDANGREVDPVSDQATCWCVIGAIDSVTGNENNASHGAVTVLDSALEGREIADFNDDPATTQTDVIALFDRAIATLETR